MITQKDWDKCANAEWMLMALGSRLQSHNVVRIACDVARLMQNDVLPKHAIYAEAAITKALALVEGSATEEEVWATICAATDACLEMTKEQIASTVTMTKWRAALGAAKKAALAAVRENRVYVDGAMRFALWAGYANEQLADIVRKYYPEVPA